MIKNIVKNLAPPFVFPTLKKIYERFNLGTPISEGIYEDLSQVPKIQGNPFEHPNWISYVSTRAESRKNPTVANQDMHEMCLSLIASTMPSTDEPESQSIVDFGGGVGMYWPVVKAQNKANANTNFVVIDSEENCVKGRKLFGEQGVDFQTDFEQVIKSHLNIKVLNVASTLHYCLDYEQVIAMLCGSKARFIVVSRHPAQEDGLPIAYTVQNVVSPNGFCGQHPLVLISVKALAGLMDEHGYTLIADYYSDADPDKYFKYAKTPIPAGFSRIIDHALVFQRRLNKNSAAFLKVS